MITASLFVCHKCFKDRGAVTYVINGENYCMECYIDMHQPAPKEQIDALESSFADSTMDRFLKEHVLMSKECAILRAENEKLKEELETVRGIIDEYMNKESGCDEP